MSPTRTDSDVVAELKSGVKTQALTFSANGECVVSGDGKNVRVWRVSDGKEIRRLAAGPVNCLAVSRDGRWITAGMLSGNVIIWDAQQRRDRKAFSLRNHYVVALDFSPDSRQLLTACFDCTTTILDVAEHKRMVTLHHDDEITAAKYSQQGDRFAVATRNFIRIYDRNNFNLSSVIRAEVTPWYNTGLLWSSDQLFIISKSRIRQIDTTIGSVASEWPVPDGDGFSCIALPQHGESIIYSTKHGVTIWETSGEHRRLDLIEHPQVIRSVAVSSDDQYLAIGGEMGGIFIRWLPRTLIIAAPTDPPLLNPHPGPPIPPYDLAEWAREDLSRRPWGQVFSMLTPNPSVSRFTIFRAICEYLDTADLMKEAVDCFRQATGEPTLGPDLEWIVYFKLRCTKRLEHLGDISMNTRHYGEAISWYSTALSLELEKPVQQGLLVKRSKAHVAAGSWKNALEDADRVIMADPSSPWGYKRKRAALHQGKDYEAAIAAFETMLSKMTQSPDPEIRELQSRYITPEDTKKEISSAIKNIIHGTPRVLIDTESGRLFDKAKRAERFESLPIFKELVSAMTTQIDVARINQEVAQYYRYATLSHTWEGEEEPTFKKVTRTTVYKLEASSTHDKLRMFCKIVHEAGIHWAWSDTCCINKKDNVVLQEALVAMFRWYERSSLTVVFLRGVRSPSRHGDLEGSIWNTRAWTFQEYHASKVVLFYNEDWTLYLDLDVPNHKELPEIISEMENATRVSAHTLRALKPGLGDIRRKLCLASGRKTTYVEDEASSLLGIFDQTLPVVPGDGDKALGRLLSSLLTNSGDTSILAWTGKSGSFNSCLPARISVFSDLQTTHIPSVTEDVQPPTGIQGWLTALATFSFVTELQALPLPMVVNRRMKLPCITFNVKNLSTISHASRRVFSAQTDALGTVYIVTDEDLSKLGPLCLAHPWIDFLLDRPPPDTTTREENTDSPSRPLPSPFSDVLPTTCHWQPGHEFHARPQDSDAGSSKPGRSISLTESHWQARALRIVTRLRQPFGALLLAKNRPYVEEYRRVAAESMIRVQVKETTSLKKVIRGVRVLDVV